MGIELHDILDKCRDAAQALEISAVGATVNVLVQMRDRRNRMRWWEYIATFFIGMGFGYIFGHSAILSKAPDYLVYLCFTIGGYLGNRPAEFIWKQIMISIRRRLGNESR